MLETVRYLADFLICPIRYPNHFNELTSFLNTDERDDVHRLIDEMEKSYCSVYAIQDSVEDIVGGIKPPWVTKDLAVDFAYFIRAVDDTLEKTSEDPSVLYDISTGDTVPPEWSTISNFVGCIRDFMGEKYEPLKKIVPKAEKGLRLEKEAETEDEVLESTRISGEVCVDVSTGLIESYTGRKVDDESVEGLHKLYFAGNLDDDISDMKEDYVFGKKTYPIIKFESYKRGGMTVEEARRRAVEDSSSLSNELYDEGMMLVKNKRPYNFLKNSMKIKFRLKMRRGMKDPLV